jgi:hypothetical protein
MERPRFVRWRMSQRASSKTAASPAADNADQWDVQAEEVERVQRIAGANRVEARGPDHALATFQDVGDAEGDEDREGEVTADEAAEDSFFEQGSCDEEQDDDDRDADQGIDLCLLQQRDCDVGAGQHDGGMAEIDYAHHAEDHGHAGGHQRVDASS